MIDILEISSTELLPGDLVLREKYEGYSNPFRKFHDQYFVVSVHHTVYSINVDGLLLAGGWTSYQYDRLRTRYRYIVQRPRT